MRSSRRIQASQVSVRESGTGGGFRKFCAGEIDIVGASRPINAAEIAQCESAGVELIELPFGFDSLAVVVNPANAFATCLTVDELKKMWEPAAEGKVTSWHQVRASFPAQPLALFGPGTASGTFDYFTLAVVGTQSSSRKDYTQSEDDMVLVDGVAANPNALGVLRLRVLCCEQGQAEARVGGRRKRLRRAERGGRGQWRPTSRCRDRSSSMPAVRRCCGPRRKAFAEFYVAPENARHVEGVGYVALPPATLLSVADVSIRT